MTVNDSFECSDIHLVTSEPVPLCQLQVSFGINQSFDPLLYFSMWGKYGGRLPGFSHGKFYWDALIGSDARVIDNSLAVVLGCLTVNWL